jgi:hypothetical protein
MENKGYKVKTYKLNKLNVVGQGLFLPLEYLPDGKYFYDDDVTKILKIQRYEPKDPDAVDNKKKYSAFTKFMTRFNWYRKLTKQRSKSYPDFFRPSDETNIQNMPWVLKEPKYRDLKYYVTEKVDYQNALYWYEPKKGFFGREVFGICSRTVRKFKQDNSAWSKAAIALNIKNRLKNWYTVTGQPLAIRGELGYSKCQGNKYCLRGGEYRFWVFDAKDLNTGELLNFNDMVQVCMGLGLDTVPILDSNYTLPDTVEEVMKYCTGTSVIYPTLREGVVIRSYDQSVSFKARSPEFLLKWGE